MKFILTVLLLHTISAKYEPNWASIDSRPLPSWYDESKIGIFMHWGVFSAPAFGDQESAFLWSYMKTGNPVVKQFMKNNYRPDWTYADFAPQFTAEFFDPGHWADIFQGSGAK